MQSDGELHGRLGWALTGNMGAMIKNSRTPDSKKPAEAGFLLKQAN
jgi:hypothetical protein